MRRLVVLLPLLALPAAAAAVPPRIPPADNCARDRSFLAFRNALHGAIARRDAAFILRAAAISAATFSAPRQARSSRSRTGAMLAFVAGD
jgi:hypothetical protein